MTVRLPLNLRVLIILDLLGKLQLYSADGKRWIT